MVQDPERMGVVHFSFRLLRTFSSRKMEYLSLLLLLVNTVYAQDDPRGDFCRRWYHEGKAVLFLLPQAVVLMDSSGEGGRTTFHQRRSFESRREGQSKFHQYAILTDCTWRHLIGLDSRLLYQDLSTVTLQGENITMPPLMTNVSKPAQVPSLLGGTLWADEANARLFQYGGQWPGDETPEDVFSLWSYDVYANEWNEKTASSTINRLSFGAGVSVESSGMGYYLGGYLTDRSTSGWTGPQVTTGNLLQYDMVLDEFRNTSTAEHGVGKAEGSMFYIPAGDQGMLIHFGGVRVTNQSDEQQPVRADRMKTMGIADKGNRQT
jgi:hypothetical protein